MGRRRTADSMGQRKLLMGEMLKADIQSLKGSLGWKVFNEEGQNKLRFKGGELVWLILRQFRRLKTQHGRRGGDSYMGCKGKDMFL